jgi:hypothetical protein
MLYQQFAIPFFVYSLDNWEDKKKNILKSLPDYKNYSMTGDVNKNDLNHYSDFHENFDKTPVYANTVIENIKDEIIKFCEDTQSDWNMVNLWFQSYEKYNHFSIHNHGPEGYSAVLYLEYDSEEHTPTIFYSPFANWIKSRLGTYESFAPDIKEGDLIIFPASIQHEVPPNFSEKRRTVISFNLK